MKNTETVKTRRSLLLKMVAMILAVSLLPVFALAEEPSLEGSEWITFLLICNEGMNNDKGNAGNTLMAVSMNEETGAIRLMPFTWDTFIDYEGYDVPQKLDMPYRNNGPEEAMKVFNANFGLNIERYMSLNYLNLASLIDAYNGVTVDITRAERNALNGMVGSKKIQLQAQVGTGLLSQAIVEMLAQEYYLSEFGPDIHLNGLQAVGFGWLQYDSVYNCCEREVEVIANLFHSVGTVISEKIHFYTGEKEPPKGETQGRRAINADNITNDDYEFLRQQIAPIFQMSFHNLTEDDIRTISLALARTAYKAAREGYNIFDNVKYQILPLEAKNDYDIVAGTKGHLVDKEQNHEAILNFLFGDD